MPSDIGVLGVVPGWVVTHPDISHSAFRVYAVLAIRLAGLGEEDAPTREALAADVGVSTDSVDRHLRRLAALGALTITKHGKQNHYTLRYAHPQVTTLSHNYPEAITPRVPTHAAGILRTNLPQTPASLLKESVTTHRNWPDGAEIYLGKEVPSKKVLSKKVLHTGNSSTHKTDAVADQPTTRVHLPRFTDLAQRYPVHRDRARAAQRWIRLGAEQNDALWVAISAGLDRWIDYWDQSDTPQHYIPLLTNWLTRQLWEDRPVVDRTETLSPQSRKLAQAARAFLKEEV